KMKKPSIKKVQTPESFASKDSENFIPIIPQKFSDDDREKKINVQGIDAVIKKRPTEAGEKNQFSEVRKMIMDGRGIDALKTLEGMNGMDNLEKANIHYYKGLAFEMIGNIPSRNDSFNKAYDLDNQNRAIKRAKIAVLIGNRDYLSAKKLLDDLIA